MNGAIVCLAGWLPSLWGHSAVGERHTVGRTIGLGLVAVLVVDHVLLWLAALDLIIINQRNKWCFYFSAEQHCCWQIQFLPAETIKKRKEKRSTLKSNFVSIDKMQQLSDIKRGHFKALSDFRQPTWGMLIPFLICSCSQRLNSSSWPVSSASSSLPSIPVHLMKTFMS